MADHLSALAARALGVARVARPRPAARFEPQPVDELDPVSAPQRRRSTIHAAERPPAAPPPVQAGPSAESRATTRTHADPVLLVPSAEADAEQPPSTAPPPARRGGEPAPRTNGPRTPPPSPLVAAQVAGRRASQPRRETRRDEPPEVHVTIGRIEVRAVAPPAPAPTRRPLPQPVPLSLDEYLEQRRSGRR